MASADYDAFISYRRSDGAGAARWLRRELERFRAPKRLAAHRDRRLKIYLDVAYERGTSDFYEGTIRPALLASRHLIVIATPDAVRRPAGQDDWIAREISDFSNGPDAGNVMVALASGALDDQLPGDLSERFPNIEIVDLRGVGRFWFLQPTRAARISNEKLKLIAPLIDLAPGDMPILRQEEERTQQMRLGLASGVSLAVVVAVAGLSVYALQNQWRAQAALDTSLFAANRVVDQVASSLTADSQRTLRSNLLNQACDLIDRLAAEASRPPSIDGRVTCMTERAFEHERQNEKTAAEKLLNEAVALAEASFTTDSLQTTALAVADAYRAVADLQSGRGDKDKHRAALEKLAGRAVALGDRFDNPFLLERAANAEGKLAGMLQQAGEIESAIAMAEAMVGHLLRADALLTSGGSTNAERSMRSLAAIGNVEAERGEKDKALAAFQRAIKIGRDIVRENRATIDGRLTTLQALIALAGLKREDPDFSAAIDDAASEVAAVEPLLPQGDADTAKRLAGLKADLGALTEQQVSQGLEGEAAQ